MVAVKTLVMVAAARVVGRTAPARPGDRLGGNLGLTS